MPAVLTNTLLKAHNAAESLLAEASEEFSLALSLAVDEVAANHPYPEATAHALGRAAATAKYLASVTRDIADNLLQAAAAASAEAELATTS